MSGQMKGSKTYVSSLIIVFFISIETEKFHLKSSFLLFLLKKACIDNFSIFVNNNANVDSIIEGGKVFY